MFRKAVLGLCRNSCGLVLVAGAIGVLTGVECVLSGGGHKSESPKMGGRKRARPGAPSQTRLKISQTRSELGYVFWVVRDPGGSPAYALFDTWQEAMDEVARRLQLRVAKPARFRNHAVLVPA